MLEHNGKQILPFEACQHPLLVWCNCARIAVVDDNRSHRRLGIRQRVSQPAHIDGSRISLNQIRSFKSGRVVFEKSAGTEHRTASGMTPRADKSRKAKYVANAHAAAGMTLQAVIHP